MIYVPLTIDKEHTVLQLDMGLARKGRKGSILSKGRTSEINTNVPSI